MWKEKGDPTHLHTSNLDTKVKEEVRSDSRPRTRPRNKQDVVMTMAKIGGVKLERIFTIQVRYFKKDAFAEIRRQQKHKSKTQSGGALNITGETEGCLLSSPETSLQHKMQLLNSILEQLATKTSNQGRTRTLPNRYIQTTRTSPQPKVTPQTKFIGLATRQGIPPETQQKSHHKFSFKRLRKQIMKVKEELSEVVALNESVMLSNHHLRISQLQIETAYLRSRSSSYLMLPSFKCVQSHECRRCHACQRGLARVAPPNTSSGCRHF